MYAVAKIGGKQWKLSPGNFISVDKLAAKPNETFNINQVLLIKQDNEVTLGKPFIDDAVIQAKVLEQGRDKKIVIFKKKRRKGYKKKQGHRQYKTTLFIEKILLGSKSLAEVDATKIKQQKKATPKVEITADKVTKKETPSKVKTT